MHPMLAYTPFLDPLRLDDYWLVLFVPLVIAVALVYKTIKLQDLTQLPRQAGMLAMQILLVMVLAAVGLWLLTEMV